MEQIAFDLAGLAARPLAVAPRPARPPGLAQSVPARTGWHHRALGADPGRRGTAGGLGIALGFAFKDTLENYLTGILMMPAPAFPPVTMW